MEIIISTSEEETLDDLMSVLSNTNLQREKEVIFSNLMKMRMTLLFREKI